eukprot:CAMPEP_0182503146 /NCGR_PEP_ID=MMETSP1321-20130603/14748_1 /TAXON_ID=91990 /ORGANISM="Bolidomonas sp., Strain RCC1657" /LENGTH=54 /DNA_ID=CAMNT_0024708257 /DNA_START=62 /DNA_END=226 /DNA_ORIENTATION=+
MSSTSSPLPILSRASFMALAAAESNVRGYAAKLKPISSNSSRPSIGVFPPSRAL